MRLFPVLAAAAAGAAATLSTASAADVLTRADPELVMEIAKGYGTAQLATDSEGDPMINGRLQGVKCVIYFYGCKDGQNCRSIQLSAGYTDDFSEARADEWNRKYRWIKAYTGDGSNFKMDVDFTGGVTREHVDAQFATWDSIIPDIKTFIRE